VGPAWHPVPSPDCHLELDLELPSRGDGEPAPSGDRDGAEPERALGMSRTGGTEGWHSGDTAAPGTPRFREP